MLKLTPIFMIKYLTKHSRKFFVLGVVASLASLSFTSCTDVDNTLGEDLVDKRPVKIDDTFILNAYTAEGTQFPSSLSNTGWLGSYKDPIYGETEASLAIPFYPIDFSLYNTLCDSMMKSKLKIQRMVLTLKLNKGVGDSLDFQGLEVHRMTDSIRAYTQNYSNSLLKDKIEGKSIGFKKYNRIKNDTIQIKLDQEFAEKIFSLTPSDTTKIDRSITAFHRKIYGLYLKSTRMAGNGGLHEVLFSNSSLSLSYTAKSKKTNKDTTLYCNFGITYNTQYGPLTPGVGFVSHTYNGTSALSPKKIVNSKTTDLGTPESLTYVQGLGGLRTLLKFDPESVKKWENKNRNIHRAELIVDVPEEGGPLDYYRLPAALSGYSMNVKDTTFIPDMAVYAGNRTNAYFNRSKKQYSINITTYFKDVMRNPSKARELYLYAGFPNGLSSSSSQVSYTTLTADYLAFPSQIILGNRNSANPFKLRITYSENE